MSDPWNMTEAQRMQFREAQGEKKRRQMTADHIGDVTDIDEMTIALRSAVKTGALSKDDAIGHLRGTYGVSHARAADLMREPS